jgi:hypothetical protein
MLAHLTHWILFGVLAQAPSEAALLKAVPADVDVAIRTRGVESTRDDLVAMLKAMNPEWGNMAEGALSAQVAQLREKHGAHAAKSPFIMVMRMGDGGGPPPFAVVVPSGNYKGTLSELSGGKDVELKHQDGDYDMFDSPDGNGSWYAAKATGVVAFGSSKELIAAIAKPGGKTLDSVLTGPSAKTFLGGDLGVYVNAASLTKRYADQIDQARQFLMNALDQAAQQAGNAATMEMVKEMYGGVFDSLKYAEGLTLNLDAGEKGLHLAGFLKVTPDVAKAISADQMSDAASLGKLPVDEMAYVYMNVSAKMFERLQGMSLKMLNPGGKPSPEVEKATAALHGMGRIESLGFASMVKGMRSLNDFKVDDPKKYVEANIAMLKAMSGGEGQLPIYKDIKIEPDSQKHQGLTFTHVALTMDIDKLAGLAGNVPGQAESMKAMFGDGKFSYWYGTDGKRLLQVIAPNWEDARTLIDGYLKGEHGVGETAGFKTVRAELPREGSILALVEVQAVIRMYVNLFATILKKPDLKVPDDMPKDPTFLGASLTPHPSEGYEFHTVIPSSVGTVIAKGVVPIFQGLAPQ